MLISGSTEIRELEKNWDKAVYMMFWLTTSFNTGKCKA